MKTLFVILSTFFLLAVPAKSQDGWFTLLSENNTTTTYTGLQFLNGDTGYRTASWGDAHNNGGSTMKTTNGGLNWFSAEWSVPRYALYFINLNTGWTCGGYWDDAGKRSREVFRTTNAGVNFTRIYIDSVVNSFRKMFFSDANTGWILAVQNIYKTTNSGVNWFICSTFYFNSVFFVSANTGWGLTSSGIIYKSTDGGTTWNSQLMVSGNAFSNITFINQNTGWVCGAQPNVYKTTNSGLNWIPYSTGLTVLMSSIDFADSLNGWICSNGGEISRTSNGGINWTLQTTVQDYWLADLSFPDQYTGYVTGVRFSTPNTHDNKLLKTTTGGTVFVQKIREAVPKSFSLSQNYPNPFNPVTKIKFSLPFLSKGGVMEVKLIVYDILGSEIANLIPPLRGGQSEGLPSEEGLSPGTYEVQWNGSNYPSGVYFYKLVVSGAEPLTTADYSETRKMVLVK